MIKLDSLKYYIFTMQDGYKIHTYLCNEKQYEETLKQKLNLHYLISDSGKLTIEIER